jgi:two-component system sensor histidine kinase SenX3
MIPVLLAVALVAVSGYAIAGWIQASRNRDRMREIAEHLREETIRSGDLATGRERFARAVDALDDGIIIVDEMGTIVARNRAAAKYVGARHAVAIAEDEINRVTSAALAGSSCTRELSLFGPPRQVLLLRAEPLWHHDKVAGAVVWARDVSEARRVDDVRRDFVANVSHELRTPIGALGLLAETVSDEDDPQVQRRLAGQMVREAERLARIVDDLLDLSVIETNEAAQLEPLAIAAVVRDALEQVRGAADVAGIEIHVADIASDLVVTGDRRQLVSALYNLLDNAVKYSERGASVDIIADKDAERVMVAVRDHGIGIPTPDLERIFERFYRVDRARSRETGGTGLGLSIVRHVAAAHGGDIAVESHEGEGSTFTLRLPLAADSEDTK